MKNSRDHETGIAFNPPIRRTDDGRYIHVNIDLPGVAEEQIRIELEQTTCCLSVMRNDGMLQTEFGVPLGARFFKKKFSEGVLEIILERKTGS
ncbi:MAG: hypothetical protein LUQ01_02485 [Methanolinea sp.]|nr:hypothetical protein [Methanolinea sp.]